MIPENWAEKPPPPKDEGKFSDIGSTTQGLPPVTKDYLPVTITHLVIKDLSAQVFGMSNY